MWMSAKSNVSLELFLFSALRAEFVVVVVYKKINHTEIENNGQATEKQWHTLRQFRFENEFLSASVGEAVIILHALIKKQQLQYFDNVC